MHLIRALRDCKQRSLTVSKKAPTVSKKLPPFFIICGLRVSEVSKRGWRTEGVGARKSLPHHKFRPFFCPLFPMPPYEKENRIVGGIFCCTFGHCWSPIPSRQPLFETSEGRSLRVGIFFRGHPGKRNLSLIFLSLLFWISLLFSLQGISLP